MTKEPSDKLRATLVRAAREVERLRKRVAKLESGASEPIAIVGIGLRLPGGVDDLDSLWSLLESEVDTTTEVPRERWDVDLFYNPDADAPGTTYTKRGAFLDDPTTFDPGLFKISPREAKAIDPQHRWLLEASWEALERAGIVPATLVDSKTGVFVGIGPSDYERLQPVGEDAYKVMGTHMSFAAGRIAFTLGLQGPTMGVDTACSSSLVAVHLACRALMAGECELALAGGVQALLSADGSLQLARTRALAPDGRCKTFSANADGYGRGEGVIVVALERLSVAQKKDRKILGVVRGSAVNHDGTSSGITAPNGTSQQRVLREALAVAGLNANDIDYVECHGTGTKLGDPIEVQALATVFGQGRAPGSPLLLGAVKPNIGHLESAAGLAGVAKVLAAMAHGQLPATIHTQPRNPHIEWSELPVAVVDRLRPWQVREPGTPLRAGVSGFGLSGTNAHVILESPPTVERGPRARVEQPVPLVLSARTKLALGGQARRLAAELERRPELDLWDVSAELSLRRTHFAHRSWLVVESIEQAVSGLRSLAERGGDGRQTFVARSKPKLALMFTGQGSQAVGMGVGLYEAFANYREVFDTITAEFDGLVEHSIKDIIFGTSDAGELIHETAYTQPALFALEVAMFRLFESWGLRPSFVLGHSIGELVAAHVAGIFTLSDACKLVAARGRLMQALPAGGAMASIQASHAELNVVVAELEGVDIAGVNGMMSTVVSGDEGPVETVIERFSNEGRKVKRLRVSHAFHSHRMEPMLDEFRQVAAGLSPSEPKITLISNVTGEAANPADLLSPDYWCRQIRCAVRFHEGVQALESEGATVLFELGPRGVLSAMAAASLAEAGLDDLPIVPALRGDKEPEPAAVLGALASLHCCGVELDWSAILREHEPRHTVLPPYAFERARHWVDERNDVQRKPSRPQSGAFALSGERVELGAGRVLHCVDIGPGVQTYLCDHVVHDHIVVPGAFYLAVLLAVADAHWPDGPTELRNVEFLRALTFADSSATTALFVDLQADEQGYTAVLFTQGAEGGRIEHVVGEIGRASEADIHAMELPMEAKASGDLSSLDEYLRSVQIEWGPRWWWTQHGANLRPGAGIGRLVPPEGVPVDDAPVPGGLIDNSFALGLWAQDLPEDDTPRLPFAVERLVWKGGDALPRFAEIVSSRADKEATIADLHYWDEDGVPVGTITKLVCRRAPRDRFIAGAATRDLYRVVWQATKTRAPEGRGSGHCALLGDDVFGLAPGLAAQTYADVDRLLAAVGDVPASLLLSVGASEGTPLDRTSKILRALQRILGEDRLAEVDITVVTRSALVARPEDSIGDLGAAAVWGLIRTAQSEYPERAIRIIDLDKAAGATALQSALATDEPQVAIRGEELLAPRLRNLVSAEPEGPALDEEGTVLITGGTGALGSLVARHLVTKHGVRHLLLVSRSGPRAANAERLRAELDAAGASSVSVVACDIGERAQLAELLSSVPIERPLRAVIHTAGVLEDATFHNQSHESLASVFTGKLDAARHLDELCEGQPLTAFVLFSSLSGVLGAPGQANYAAANAGLDALAVKRVAEGKPAMSLAWGAWAEGGMAARLSEADQARMKRSGLSPLTSDHGLALFDAALTRSEAVLVPVKLDKSSLARADRLPTLLQGLVRVAPKRNPSSHPHSDSTPDLQSMSVVERGRCVASLVRTEVSAVLGSLPEDIGDEQEFGALGLDSLMAVELRSRLQKATGLRLSPTYMLDHDSVGEVVANLCERLDGHYGHSEDGEAEDEVWRDDLELGNDMEFAAYGSDTSPSEVLLTGATGFLGVHVLAVLLARSELRVHALVRAEDVEHGRERLVQAFARWGLDATQVSSAEGRLVVHAGDLGQEQLGCSEASWSELITSVDVVIANAAAVNWLDTYATLRPTNVVGALRVLELAARGKPKRFVQVSSVAACPVDEQGRMVEQVNRGRPLGGLGYGMTKFVSERHVDSAAHRGLNSVIVRPALISSHSATGVVNPAQVEFRFIRACVELGAVPDIDLHIDLTPVDVVAAMVVEAAMRSELDGVLHLGQLSPYSPRWLSEVIRSCGWACHVVGEAEWRRQLDERISAGDLELVPARDFMPILRGLRPFDTTRGSQLLKSARRLPNPTEVLRRGLQVATQAGLLKPTDAA